MTRSNDRAGLPRVAIVGRPNVGKSTLFNRLSGRRRSITDPTPGVTRDPVEIEATIGGRRIVLVDTGGYTTESRGLEGLVSRKSLEKVVGADCIVLVMEVKEVTPEDEEFIARLRPHAARIILAVNKVDNEVLEDMVWAFHEHGIERVVWISSTHGRNMEALEAEILEMIGGPSEDAVEEPAEDDRISIAILGKPNTGKSTLANLLTGTDASIVSEVPGTTRDVIEGGFEYGGYSFRLLDTAGIRKKGKIGEDVEYYSVNRAIKSISEADIILLVIDVQEGITEQDKKIASVIVRRGKGVILVMNKWDVLPDIPNRHQAVIDRTRFLFPVLDFAPLLRFSALKGTGTKELLAAVIRVWKQLNTRIETPALNRSISAWTESNPPPMLGSGRYKVLYGTQVSANPLQFVLFVNKHKGFPRAWTRYLLNRLRETFDITEVPIELLLRER